MDYSADTTGVTINLTTNSASGGDATGDTISGFENVTGGSGADTLTGTSGANVIDGGGGADVIEGGAGDDVLDGSAGNDRIALEGGADTIDGGADHDILDVYLSTDVTVDLGTGIVTGTGVTGTTVTGIEEIWGGSGNDTYIGSANADTIYGWNGNDTISGAGGDDFLYGESGNDTLEGGAGADTLVGGSGTDTLSYASDTTGVTVNLATNSASGGDAAGDTISGFENVTGGSGNDSLTGDANANVITGGGGSDLLVGGAGNDTLTGGDESGSSGTRFRYDYFDLSGVGPNNLADAGFLAGGQNSYVPDGTGFIDSLDEDGIPTLYGGSGDDFALRFSTTLQVTSAGTYDFGLSSDDGSRLFVDGIEVIDHDGQHGTSTANGSIELSSGAHEIVIIFFEAGGSQDLDLTISGPDTGNTPVDISTYGAVSAMAGDHLIGGGDNDNLSGGAGNDILEGGDGSDILDGGADDDILDGGAGADTLTGGSGTDTLSYATDTTGVTVNLATNTVSGGDAAGDTISGFENIFGGSGNDTLTGDANANVISGGAGDDTLTGGDGNDSIDGGAGTDTVVYAGSIGDYTMDVSSGIFTITDDNIADGDDGTDTFTNVEYITFQGSGDTVSLSSYITGANNGTAAAETYVGTSSADSTSLDAGNDVIFGGRSSDTALTGGGGDDLIVGGQGNDMIYGDGAGSTALVFNQDSDTGDYAYRSNFTGFPSTAISFEVVMKSNVLYQIGSPIVSYAVSSDSNEFMIIGRPDNSDYDGQLEIFIDGSSVLVPNVGTMLFDGTEHRLSVTWQSSTGDLKVYVDGTQQYSGTFRQGGTIEGGGTLVFGQEQDSVGGGFNSEQIFVGTMDDIRLFNDVRTSTEVSTYAGIDTTVSSSESGLVANWLASSSSGSTVDDVTSGNRDMTLAGNASVDVPTQFGTTNYITNGSFESGFTGWTTASGSNELHSGTFNGVVSADGNYFLDTDNNSQNLSFYQNVSGLTAGETYQLTFYAAEYANGSNETLDVYWGGVKIGDIDPTQQTMTRYVFNVVSGSGNGSDRLQFIENGTVDGSGTLLDEIELYHVPSDTGADTLYGGVGSDTIYGGTGDDWLYGGSGNDTLYGEDGADTIYGGDGDDIIWDGSGADTLDGGEGSDTYYFEGVSGGVPNIFNDTGTSGTDTIILQGSDVTFEINADFSYETTGIEVIDGSGLSGESLGSGGVAVDYDFTNVTLIGIDQISGSNNADTIIGSAAADTIYGGSGNDTLQGGGGNDTIDGAFGTDTVVYAGRIGDYSVDQSGGTITVIDDNTADGNEGTDTLTNVEYLYFAGSGHTINISSYITGDGGSGAETYIGTSSADSVSTNGGNDVIFGGRGGDWNLNSGDGNDIISGGSGDDTIYFGTGTDEVYGGAGNDTIDDASGTSYNYDNYLDGGSGNDTIWGGGGNDTIIGGSGADQLHGEDGTGDTLSYETDTTGVTVNLATGTASGGDATGDTFDTFENLTGGSGNDTLTGTSGNNVLTGNAGNDTIYSGGGDDTIYGGDGNDSITMGTASGDGGTASGGAGDDTFYINENQFIEYGADAIDGGTGEDIVHVTSDGGVSESAMVNALTNIETIDVRDLNVNASLSLAGNQVQAMTDSDNILTILSNSGDTVLGVAGAGEYMSSNTVGSTTTYTYFDDAGMTNQIAELIVQVA